MLSCHRVSGGPLDKLMGQRLSSSLAVRRARSAPVAVPEPLAPLDPARTFSEAVPRSTVPRQQRHVQRRDLRAAAQFVEEKPKEQEKELVSMRHAHDAHCCVPWM